MLPSISQFNYSYTLIKYIKNVIKYILTDYADKMLALKHNKTCSLLPKATIFVFL